MSELDLEQTMDFRLEDGIRLRLLQHSMAESKRIYEYTYRHKTPDGRNVDVYNEWKLTVPYTNGIVGDKIELSMHIVLPERLGKEFAWGVDISPGAKTYVEFDYRRVNPDEVLSPWRLDEVRVGSRKTYRFDVGPGLIRPVEFPFPVPDLISVEHNAVAFPVLLKNDTLGEVDLPIVILRLWAPPAQPSLERVSVNSLT